MSRLELYRDSDGAPRAKGEDTRPLAQFLESDIQDDIETCEELIAVADDPDPDIRADYDFVGNSFALSFDGEEVILVCHAVEDAEETRLRRSTVQEALHDWKDFISGDD